jgi:hypothetical protein
MDNDEYVVENIGKNRIIIRSTLSGTKLIKDYSYFFAKNIKKKDDEVD